MPFLSKYMNQTYRIRYNTNATDDTNCWRIIFEDNTELLVDHIDIQVPMKTTKDWIEKTKQYKYHLTCEGSLVISLENKAIII